MPIPLPAQRTDRSPRPLRPAMAAAALLLGTLALAGCGGNNLPQFPPACPATGILRDAADITRFRSAGTDLTDMVVDGRITGIAGKCVLDDATHLRTVISVSMELTRGPAAPGRQMDVTYFVSVSRGQTILDKKDYTFNVSFPRNTERLRLAGDQVDLVLPVDTPAAGSGYSVLVGFQLTPEQLAFNRRRGVR